MKTIKMLLLALVLILIVGYAVNRTWAPEITPAPVVETQQPITATFAVKDGRQCFAYTQEATTAAPYAVKEVMDITIDGTTVSGTKRGTQNGPNMTNGYDGTLSGTFNGDAIDAIFAYVVEGSAAKEKEMYRTTPTGIEKLRYPLIDRDGILVPDTSKDFSILSYSSIDCTGN